MEAKRIGPVLCLIAGGGALLVLNAALFYVGILASDDWSYAGYANLLANGTWELPSNHWEFRYPVVFPQALIIALFGMSEATTTILPLIYTVLCGALLIYMAHRAFGFAAALSVCLVYFSFPLVIVSATVINVDIPEAFFLLASVGLLYRAFGAEIDDARTLLILSGIGCGLAMLTRETAYGLLLVYGLMFLRGAQFPRSRYLWGALGVGIVIAIEWVSFMALGESPLFRFLTVAESHGTIGLGEETFKAGSGNISDNRLIGPILSLLVNQEFGVLFFVAPVAAISLWRSGSLNADQRRFIGLLIFAGFVWFLWIGYSGALRPLPRYFTFDALVAIIIIGAWMKVVLSPRWRLAVLGGLIASNYACLSVDNTNPRFFERNLRDYALQLDERIASDPKTMRLTSGFFAMTTDAVASEELNLDPVLPEGALYAAHGDRIESDARLSEARKAALRDGTAEVVTRAEPPLLLVGHILGAVGADTLLPPDFYRRLAVRNPSFVVYRLGPDG